MILGRGEALEDSINGKCDATRHQEVKMSSSPGFEFDRLLRYSSTRRKWNMLNLFSLDRHDDHCHKLSEDDKSSGDGSANRKESGCNGQWMLFVCALPRRRTWKIMSCREPFFDIAIG